MRISLLAAALFLLSGCWSPVTAQKCLAYGPTVSLTGTVHSRVFPGPPNYESIKKGDRKETVWLLTLAESICTTGDDPSGIDVPETGVREVQLVITNNTHWQMARRLAGKRAMIEGTLFHAHTGHHRTKVLIEVANLRRAGVVP
jgi:hypothetical protein